MHPLSHAANSNLGAWILLENFKILRVLFFGFLKSFFVPLECSFFLSGFCPTLVRYGEVVLFIYRKIFKVLNTLDLNGLCYGALHHKPVKSVFRTMNPHLLHACACV